MYKPFVVGILITMSSGVVSSGNYIIADTIYKNGAIYTLSTDKVWANAIAIKDGVFSYVGNNQGVEKYRGPNTKVVDLKGKMVMPGVNDTHVHISLGGAKNLYECNFSYSATGDELASEVAECVESTSSSDWIVGGQWAPGFFERNKIASPRKYLDAISGDKAVLLSDISTHNGWANSKALELAGINKNTPDPKDGQYLRGVDNEPNGILLEGADKAVRAFVPDWSDAQYRAIVIEVLRSGHQFGVTGINDAGSQLKSMAAAYQLDQERKVDMHIVTSIRTPYGYRNKPLDYARIDRVRDKYKGNNVHTAYVKIFMDGIPTASHTAAMLTPYQSKTPEQKAVMGDLHISSELLAQDVVELDKRGYTVKIHAAGDRSVRVALDAIEAARKENGASGLRHEVAHAALVDAEDLTRFSALGAIAEQSPATWYPSPITDAVQSAIGHSSTRRYWPMFDLVETGALLTAGSDWPSVVQDMNPWPGIESMVTRRNPFLDNAEPKNNAVLSGQGISLEQALRIHTLNGALAFGLDQITGSIELGKSADLIVLDRNLFKIDISDVSSTKVLTTLFKGKVVYTTDLVHE